MSGLAHYIERAGVATTCISLIREHTEAVGPPRALWVSFPLGRPLGIADDADFQRGVLRAALGLLETATEPVIADYPKDVPSTPADQEWVCPVSFPAADEGSLESRFLREIARLKPWAEETRKARGRSLLGASGGAHDDVDRMATILVQVAEGASLHEIPEGSGRSVDWWHPMPFLLRHLADDLRILYHEAVASRPGEHAPDHDTLTHWIFDETVLGEVLLKVAEAITAAGERRLLTLRGYLIPEGRFAGDESFGRRQPGDPPGFMRAVVGNKYLRGEGD